MQRLVVTLTAYHWLTQVEFRNENHSFFVLVKSTKYWRNRPEKNQEETEKRGRRVPFRTNPTPIEREREGEGTETKERETERQTETDRQETDRQKQREKKRETGGEREEEGGAEEEEEEED